MRVIITSSHRFRRTPDGQIWTGASFSYEFWRRYLDVFDEVIVVSRIKDVQHVPKGWNLASGPSVGFFGIPYYVGPLAYLRKSWAIRRVLRSIDTRDSAIILRSVGTPFNPLIKKMKSFGQPYGLEILGDPQEVFARGAMKHPLRRPFRWIAVRALRRAASNAAAVSYVSMLRLSERYPAAPGAFVTHYSSIELQDSHFVDRPSSNGDTSGSVHMVTVGSLAQAYKGVDDLIESLTSLVRDGIDIKLSVAGDGQHRAALEDQARKNGMVDRVHFLGHLPGGEMVRQQLDESDLFVLASRTEGLPRAMIEAMARGLPCLGTDVGGIPELLAEEDLVPPNNVPALAQAIREVINDQNRMSRMAARNHATAKHYRSETLRGRRIAMYTALEKATKEWRSGGVTSGDY